MAFHGVSIIRLPEDHHGKFRPCSCRAVAVESSPCRQLEMIGCSGNRMLDTSMAFKVCVGLNRWFIMVDHGSKWLKLGS